MRTRRTFVAMLLGCVLAGMALAAPEMPPKELKGQIAGEITKKDGPRITVKGEERSLTLMPHWRGGMPKDGGGFDKEMVKRLEQFKVGDRVKVKWEFEEHYRILAIDRLEKSE